MTEHWSGIRTSEGLDALAPALAKAQEAIGSVPKSGHNNFDNYDYAELKDYIETVKPHLSGCGLMLCFGSPECETLEKRQTAKGTDMHVARMRLSARLLHTSGQWLEIDAWGEGEDRSDKAVYKATTGARKYAIACLLNLATSDDPEKTRDAKPTSQFQGGTRAPKTAPKTPSESKPPSNPKGSEFITRKQLERMWAIAQEREQDIGVSKNAIARDVLGKRGIEHSDEVPWRDYAAVCDEIKAWEPPQEEADDAPIF